MERFVLQCRQLIPIMSDRHLIKKLARHYNREIQVAVVTRGITTINNFETVLREYMNVSSRTNNDIQKGEEWIPRKVNERSNFHRQKQWSDEQRRGWRKDYAPKPKAESGPPVINSLIVDIRHQVVKAVGRGTQKCTVIDNEVGQSTLLFTNIPKGLTELTQ